MAHLNDDDLMKEMTQAIRVVQALHGLAPWLTVFQQTTWDVLHWAVHDPSARISLAWFASNKTSDTVMMAGKLTEQIRIKIDDAPSRTRRIGNSNVAPVHWQIAKRLADMPWQASFQAEQVVESLNDALVTLLAELPNPPRSTLG